MERFVPNQFKEKKPGDIRLAEFSKKLDKVQIAAGAVLLPFLPALGLSLIVWNTSQHYLTDRYIAWRNKRSQQFPRAA